MSWGVLFVFFLKRDRWSFSLRSCVSVPRLRYSYLSVEESPAPPTSLPLHPTHTPQRRASTMTQHLTRRESFLHTDWAMALFAHCVIGFYWKPVKPLVFHHPPHQGPPCPSLPLPPSLIDWSELTLAELRWAAFNDISFLTSTTGRFGWSNAAAAVESARGSQRSSQTDGQLCRTLTDFFLFYFIFYIYLI